MKKISILFFLCVTLFVNAQYSPLPPLGIKSDIPRAGSVGSQVWEMGIQAPVRTKAFHGRLPKNRDATRFLEKAVKENNVENAKKFLEAGASAFISYNMIDKKQYDMIDAMYQDNSKLIRYSQLLHYACAKSDPQMIDFLIERGASLDLYGFYVSYVSDYKTYAVMCEWNNDEKYMYTPADVALRYGQWDNLKHIEEKYKKYPSIYGFNNALIAGTKNSATTEYVRKVLSQDTSAMGFSVAEGINFAHFTMGYGGLDCEFLLNAVVKRIADERRSKSGKDADFVNLLNLLLEKGADVNVQADNGAFTRRLSSIGINNVTYAVDNTPLYIAVKNPGMLDIIKLLISKGASTTTKVNGKTVSVVQLRDVMDEYKEYFMLEGIK